MVAPVRKDNLTDYQVALATYLRITSPVAGMFTGSEIKPNPNARSIMVPDIRVDDYMVDVELARIGSNHMQGSSFVDKWINGLPPIEWRQYSMSRHRSFGYVIFDDQVKYSPIKNLEQEYLGRKMQTTVLRDHDKYVLLAALSGHMTGKLVARTAEDTPGPAEPLASQIACTGNAADYKWIAEPGETFDNEIQPSFAAIKGMYLDKDNPMLTFDTLNVMFSDNWFDSNFGNQERFFIITTALELVFLNYLVDKGAGTESGFKMLREGDVSGAQAAGYIGSLRGWKFQKMHPEFFPKLFTDANLVVDPVANTKTSGRTLRQVAAIAVYKNAIQTYENFAEKREQDGGIRFKGKEYAQDFSYDAWVIDQYSEGVVPLFLPETVGGLKGVQDSFNNVAAMVSAARAATDTTKTYPMNPAVMGKSNPQWYHAPYEGTTNLKTGAGIIADTGDISHRNPVLDSDKATSGTTAAPVETPEP